MSVVASAATIREMEDVFRMWEKLAQTAEPEKLAALVTDDCIWQYAGMQPSKGRQACISLIRHLMGISTDSGTKPMPKEVLHIKVDPQHLFVDNMEHPHLIISAHTFTQKMADGSGAEPLHGQGLGVYVRAPANHQVKWLAKTLNTSLTTPPPPQLEAIMKKMVVGQAGKAGASAATIKELEDVFRMWEKHAQTGEPEKVVALLTDDCIWQYAGMQPSIGKQACIGLIRHLMGVSTDSGTKPMPKEVLHIKLDPQHVLVDNMEHPHMIISAHTFTQKLAEGFGAEPLHGQGLGVYIRAPANHQVKWLAKTLNSSLTTPPPPQLEAIMKKMPVAQAGKTGTTTSTARATGTA